MKQDGFGERLKALIKQKQLTQAQVANAVGTSVPSVNRWTKGGEIEYENLRALADFLEVNWVWLRYGDEAIESLQVSMSEAGAMTDMRREYLNQILENEASMKASLEMAQIVSWEWNTLTSALKCSQNAAQVFGVELDKLPNVAMPFRNLPLEKLIRLFDGDETYNWDFEITAGDKSIKSFTSQAKLIYDASNRPMKVIGISADITARKQAEQAVQRSEYMMRKIIEIIPVGLWVADEQGVICMANPEVKRIWGGARYVGLDHYGEYKGWWEKTGKELGAEGWTLARAIKYGETSMPEVVNIEAFDGQHRTIIMYATPLCDADNHIIGAIEINLDITELKNTEHTLKQTLEEWPTELQEALEAVGQLDPRHYIQQIVNRMQLSAEEISKQFTAEK